MTLKSIWRFCASIEFCLELLALVWMRSRPRESGLVEVENEVVSQGIVV
jgi:hypothetical protein